MKTKQVLFSITTLLSLSLFFSGCSFSMKVKAKIDPPPSIAVMPRIGDSFEAVKQPPETKGQSKTSEHQTPTARVPAKTSATSQTSATPGVPQTKTKPLGGDDKSKGSKKPETPQRGDKRGPYDQIHYTSIGGNKKGGSVKPKPPTPVPAVRVVDIDLSKQRVTVTETSPTGEVSKVLFQSPCSSGRPTLPTPTGVTVVPKDGKESSHHSSEFNCDLPNWVNTGITDSSGLNRGIGIHEGNLYGYPSTHRCVRLPKGKAKEFYDLVGPGTTIKIYGNAWDSVRDTFPGFKLLSFDNQGNLLGFKKRSDGTATDEFIDYVKKGGKMNISSVDSAGRSIPKNADKSTWVLGFEFMDQNLGQQGIRVLDFERQTGATVSFNTHFN